MANDFRVDIGFQRHPKTIQLRNRLGPEGVLALLELWAFATINAPDGVLKISNEGLALAAGWHGDAHNFLETLLNLRFLNTTKKGFQIHGWRERQPWVVNSKARSDKAKRAAAARWRGDARSNARSNAHTIPNHTIPNQTIPDQTKADALRDFIGALKENPAYKGLDIERELHKMDAWLLTPKGRGRRKTHRFILDWLNRAERDFGGDRYEEPRRTDMLAKIKAGEKELAEKEAARLRAGDCRAKEGV